MSARRKRIRPRRWWLYCLVILAVGYLLAPFIWLVGASLMTQREQVQGHWIPREPTLENYLVYVTPAPTEFAPGEERDTAVALGAATARSFGKGMRNSFIVGFSVVLFNIVLGSLAAYGLARLPSKINLPLLMFYLISRSVPAVAIMIPMYLMMQRVGLLDTPLSIVLAHCYATLPFTVWLLKGYFQTVPVDLERAARIDGCSRLKALWRVFLPVTMPGLVAAGIFSFITSWGEFLFALLFSTTLYSKTLTVLASEFVAEIEIPFPLVAAGGVIAVLLPVALAFLFQRFIVRGIGGAVTG